MEKHQWEIYEKPYVNTISTLATLEQALLEQLRVKTCLKSLKEVKKETKQKPLANTTAMELLNRRLLGVTCWARRIRNARPLVRNTQANAGTWIQEQVRTLRLQDRGSKRTWDSHKKNQPHEEKNSFQQVSLPSTLKVTATMIVQLSITEPRG